MEKGHFYFIKEQYFIDFHDDKLMKNKENINGQRHNRPSFFAFEEANGIYWR